MGARQRKKCQGEKGSEAIIKKKKIGISVKRRMTPILKYQKDIKIKLEPLMFFIFLIREIYSIGCRKSLFKAFCCIFNFVCSAGNL